MLSLHGGHTLGVSPVLYHHPCQVALKYRWKTAQKWASKSGCFLVCGTARLGMQLGLAMHHRRVPQGGRSPLELGEVLQGPSAGASTSSFGVHGGMVGLAPALDVSASGEFAPAKLESLSQRSLD